MSTQDKKELQTLQARKTELVKQVNALNIEGFNVDFLETFDVQGLQNLLDDSDKITKRDDKKVKTNISTDLLAYCVENKLDNLTKREITDLIGRFNLKGYFSLPNDYNVFKPFAQINAEIITGRIKSNSKTMVDSSKRLNAWLNRKEPYLNSHVTGQTDGTALFNNVNAKSYFIEDKGIYKIIDKVETKE